MRNKLAWRGRELLLSIEHALEARRALKEFFKAAGIQTQDSTSSRSRETALLEQVEQTRNDFQFVLGKYVDQRIQSALSR